MLRFLTRRAGPDLGAGLLGELFRVAFERRGAFDLERASARPWRYGIATNLPVHRSRSAAREARATRTRIYMRRLFGGSGAVRDKKARRRFVSDAGVHPIDNQRDSGADPL